MELRQIETEITRFDCLQFQVFAILFYCCFCTTQGGCIFYFQSLAVSMPILSLASFVLDESFRSLLVCGLSTLWKSEVRFLFCSIWKGYDLMFIEVQASVYFISPASWFTEGRLYFSSRDLHLMWSFKDTPSTILSN